MNHVTDVAWIVAGCFFSDFPVIAVFLAKFVTPKPAIAVQVGGRVLVPKGCQRVETAMNRSIMEVVKK